MSIKSIQLFRLLISDNQLPFVLVYLKHEYLRDKYQLINVRLLSIFISISRLRFKINLMQKSASLSTQKPSFANVSY